MDWLLGTVSFIIGQTIDIILGSSNQEFIYAAIPLLPLLISHIHPEFWPVPY